MSADCTCSDPNDCTDACASPDEFTCVHCGSNLAAGEPEAVPLEDFWTKERTFTATELAQALVAADAALPDGTEANDLAADIIAALKTIQG